MSHQPATLVCTGEIDESKCPPKARVRTFTAARSWKPPTCPVKGSAATETDISIKKLVVMKRWHYPESTAPWNAHRLVMSRQRDTRSTHCGSIYPRFRNRQHFYDKRYPEGRGVIGKWHWRAGSCAMSSRGGGGYTGVGTCKNSWSCTPMT